MRQYETAEFTLQGPEPSGSHVSVDVTAVFRHGDSEKTVKGFYAGDGVYKVRFYPEEAGEFSYEISGIVSDKGTFTAEQSVSHGMVKTKGTHFAYEDGTWFYPFGTTVYALASQTDALMDETIESIKNSPFNKVRMCVFPKHYHYNNNEPQYYAFRKTEGGAWDVNHPDFRFWDAFEDKIRRLGDLGVQVDVILFHPYDNWGFASMPQQDNLVYLDYLLRRFAALPNLWWSMANEYDLCSARTLDDWYEIERYITDHDPYHHLLSSHNCFHAWDATRPAVTHSSLQVKLVDVVTEEMARTHKPVMIDECCYEGNLSESWGSISGQEMTSRFWKTVTCGGYCTHGETFLDDTVNEDDAIVWWAKGGRLTGTSPARIAWLRDIVNTLPGPIEPTTSPFDRIKSSSPEQIMAMLPHIPEQYRSFVTAMARMTAEERQRLVTGEYIYSGHVGDEALLWYLDRQTSARYEITLPGTHKYTVEVLDTWNMTRTTFAESVSGKVTVRLPGREYMAILATAPESSHFPC